ncbi:MAG: hypothetical protein M3O62_06725 [Pseudomonadota bacterium]|nr:hypothetical protein [Pseudomonadota bacterium]
MSNLWDWFQQKQIADNSKRSSEAGFDAKSALRRVDELEKRIETLSLLCRALVEELERSSGVSEDQIKARMLDIDLRDGRQDGKYDPKASVTCSGCGRTVAKKREGCMWCGERL